MTEFARGENYEITLVRGLAYCRVWSRPDLDREQGARLAEEKIAHFQSLVGLSRLAVRGVVFDLRDAPTKWGPTTQAALERIASLWEHADRRIAFVSTDALQRILVRDLLQNAAPERGAVFNSTEDANAWASG